MTFDRALALTTEAIRRPLPGLSGQLPLAPRPRRGWNPGVIPPDARPAAGLILFFPFRGEATLLLTVRARHLSSHQGQVALPGGAVEPRRPAKIIPEDGHGGMPRLHGHGVLVAGDAAGVVISEETAKKNKIAIGELISLDLGDSGISPWEVIGTYRVIYGNGYLVEPIYASLDQVAQIPGLTDQGTQLLVRSNSINNLQEETALSDQLKTLLEDAGIRLDFYTTSARLEQRRYANNQFNTVVTMLINLSLLVGVVGGIGLMGSLGISVVERRREIGVLRAIRARSGTARAPRRR